MGFEVTLPTCAALLAKTSLLNCQRMPFRAFGLVPVHTAGPRTALASTNSFLVRATFQATPFLPVARAT